MQFGLHIADFTFDSGPAQLGPTLARHVRHAEDAGIQRITVMDHFWQLPGIGPVEHEMLEAYTTLGYLAAAYAGSHGMVPPGTEAVTATFVIRCLFSPFAHPLFTTFIGIGVGIAVTSRSGAVRFLAPVGGYVLAVLAHGLWNGSTVFGLGSFVAVYLVLMVPALIGMFALAFWARRAEQRMLGAALGDAAQRGLLPATDIAWVVDLRARRTARSFARQHGGREGEQAMRVYQQAAIELGFLHHRYLRGTPPPDFAVRGQEHVRRISAVRPSIAFPGQVVPTRMSAR